MVEALRKAMNTCEMSDRELARLVKVSQPTITRFRNGTRGLSLATADKLARALGLELRERT